MFSFALSVPFLVVSLQHTLSAAFSWQFTASPTQCSNLTISIVGSDGRPPYSVLIIPYGPTPLANNVDPRANINRPFDGDSTSISFAINYPANSHFVAVVSDANGFGTGGASVETVVANSGDSSCFDPTKAWLPPFEYGVGQDNQIMQCQPTYVWWNTSESQGTVSIVGVIPGGQCFVLPVSKISTDPTQRNLREFIWTPDIQGGATVMIVAGDNRGMGAGGSGQFTVQSSNNVTCLNAVSPSSTSGEAPGSLETSAVTSGASSTSSATGTGASDTTNDGGGGPNIKVIVPAAIGAIIGLFIIIALIIWSLRRNRRSRPLLPHMRQVNTIATAPATNYHLDPFVDPVVGTYNHGYASSRQRNVEGMVPSPPPSPPPYSGEGNVEGMPSNATHVVSPPLRSSVTSGNGTRMFNISSQIRSFWYGRSPSQGDSSGLQQTGGLGSVTSRGGIVHDTNQKGLIHLAPPPALSQGASSGVPQASELAGVQSGEGGIVHRTSIQKGSRHLEQPVPSQGASSGISQASGLASVRSGEGGVVYDTSSQRGSRYLAQPPAPSQDASSGIAQASGLASVQSGGGCGGVHDMSNQRGSRYRAPSVTSTTGGAPRGDPNPFSPEELLPAFTPSDRSKKRPTGDVKYNIANPE